jgi:hypothetical protein
MMTVASPPPIIIHSLDQALVAAAAAESVGSPLVLRSAPGAAGYAGVGWFAALASLLAERHPALEAHLVLDCADEAGTVLGAIRRGIKRIRFTGPPEIAARLQAIAAAEGAVLDDDPRPALDLLDLADPEAACRRWLAGGQS